MESVRTSRTVAHPRIRAQLEDTSVKSKKELAANRTACIAKLEVAIEKLKELNCPPGCDNTELLIEIFEWALAEFKETDAEPSTDPNRVAIVGRLLQRFSEQDH